MRHPILCSALLILPLAAVLPCLAEEPAAGNSLKESTKAAVSSAISAGKNLLGGVSEGITEGRINTEGIDGAAVVADYAQLTQVGSVELLKMETRGSGLAVTLGFRNSTAKPLRIINLLDGGSLIAIDADGYSSPLAVGSNPDELTVPANVGVRQVFHFETSSEAPHLIRLWGHDLKPK